MQKKDQINLSLLEVLFFDLKRFRELMYGDSNSSNLKIWLAAFSPRFSAVFLFRLSSFAYINHLPFLSRFFSSINYVINGIEIATACKIGEGLCIPHSQGTVIGAISIGNNAIIFQNVTLGAQKLECAYNESSRPVLGDEVIVGAGAKIIGGIRIGNKCTIGANAVVLHSAPGGSTLVGIPAKIISSSL